MTADDTLDPVIARELEELEAAFAAPLRDLKAAPDPVFARELDARAAAGFPRRRPRIRIPRPALPIAGLALSGACAVLVVVAVTSGSGGGDVTTSAGGGGAQSAAKAPSSAAAGADATSETLQPVAPVAPVPGPSGSPSSDSRSKRYVQRSAAITLAARPADVADAADAIVGVADRLGGFVVSSSVTATDGNGGGGEFLLRVPASRLQEALAQLSRIAHVRERRQDATDITSERVSAADRLAEARAERSSLLKRLAKAATDTEASALRARIKDADRRIAIDKRALTRVDNRARFANIAVSLVADPRAGAVGPKKHEGGRWTPGDAAHDALRVLEVAAGVLLIALAVLVPLGLVAALVVVAVRVSARRGRERALDAV